MIVSRTHKLYDFYKNLLTTRQQEIFEATVFDDLSLSEAANQFDVSRSAIHDTIKKVEKALLDYEKKLSLVDKSDKRAVLYNKIEDLELRDDLASIDLE